MFDHVEIKVVRVDDCRRFYATVLAPLLIALKWADKDAQVSAVLVTTRWAS